MSRQTFEIDVPLPPKDVVYRLREVTQAPSWSRPAGIMGNVSETGVTIWVNRPKFTKTSFQTLFVGRIRPTDSGSRLRGRFRMPWRVRAGFFVWFGLVALVFAGIILHVKTGDASLGLLKLPISMILFGACLVFVGRIGRADDIIYIARRLEEALLPGTTERSDVEWRYGAEY